MNLVEDMRKIDSKRNPVFVAIDNLKNPDDIQRFASDYESWMVQNDETVRGREHEIACSNIGYILGYYGDETQKLWYGNLPDVSHPVFGSGFGRGKEVTLEEAFAKGIELGKKWKTGEKK